MLRGGEEIMREEHFLIVFFFTVSTVEIICFYTLHIVYASFVSRWYISYIPFVLFIVTRKTGDLFGTRLLPSDFVCLRIMLSETWFNAIGNCSTAANRSVVGDHIHVLKILKLNRSFSFAFFSVLSYPLRLPTFGFGGVTRNLSMLVYANNTLSIMPLRTIDFDVSHKSDSRTLQNTQWKWNYDKK